MTRNYGRIKTSIWTDEDFRLLSDSAQALYLRLLSAPSMNLCGVCDWRPKRIALLTKGMTVEKIKDASEELEAARYIVIDEDSDEVLIRTFIKHESVVQNPKTAAGCEAAFVTVVSWRLRATVSYELRRLRNQIPDLKGWDLVSTILGFATDWVPDTQSHTRSDWVSGRVSDPVPIHQEPFTKNQEPETADRETSAIADPTQAEVRELCNLLADLIEGNGSKRPVVGPAWLTPCRLMVEQDGRSVASIRSAIEWSQKDEFWRANILSMSKLREKYDQLRLQAMRETKGSKQQETDTQFDRMLRRAQERDNPGPEQKAIG